jgi:hypothetical protein
MKKFFLDHPMVLKGLLAVALLANLSYTPLFRNIQVESINLSEEGVTTPPATAAPAPTDAGPTTPPASAGPQPVASAAATCDLTVDPTMTKTAACIKTKKDREAAAKDPIQGSLRQVRTKPIPATALGNRDSQNKATTPTAAKAPPKDETPSAARPSNDNAVATRLEGDKGCQACEKAAQDANLKKILDQLTPETAAIVRAALKMPSSGSPTPLAASADEPAVKTPQEIADGVRTCANDEKGEELSDINELTCQSRRLSRLSGSEHEQVESRIDKLYADLKQEIKDDFESSSAADHAKGTMLLAKVTSALQRADFKSSSKADKMVGALEGIRAGSELKEKTANLKDEVNDLQKDYRTAYAEFNSAKAEYMSSCQMGRCDYSLIMKIQEKYAAIAQLGDQAAQVKSDLSDNLGDDVSDLQQYKQYLSSAEYSGYIRGEEQLQAQVIKIDNPSSYPSLSTSTMPNMFGLTNSSGSTASSFGNTALNGVPQQQVIGNTGAGLNIPGTKVGSPFLVQLGLQQPGVAGPNVYAGAQQVGLQQPSLLQQSVSPQIYNGNIPLALTTQYNPAVYSNNSLSPLIH